VFAIEFRNRDAERAIRQLRIQEGSVQQQVRTVQRHAERNPPKTSCHHRNPGSEISVVNMDVVHILVLKDGR
jgi:hypothetical protein